MRGTPNRERRVLEQHDVRPVEEQDRSESVDGMPELEAEQEREPEREGQHEQVERDLTASLEESGHRRLVRDQPRLFTPGGTYSIRSVKRVAYEWPHVRRDLAHRNGDA